MQRYWYYTLCTMYVTVLSGSLLDSLGKVLERPHSVVQFLGESLPQVSVYFLSVVLSKGLLTLPMTALRPLAFAAWTWQHGCGFGRGVDTEQSDCPYERALEV